MLVRIVGSAVKYYGVDLWKWKKYSIDNCWPKILITNETRIGLTFEIWRGMLYCILRCEAKTDVKEQRMIIS